MSYGLLWVETVLVGLLWAAVLIACAQRIRALRYRWLVMCVALGTPLALSGALTALSAYLKFSGGFSANWFWYTLAMSIVLLIGATILLIKGTRRPQAGMPSVGASWPRGRLSVALLTAAALASMTIWNMDLEARGRAAALQVQAGTMVLAVSPPPIPDSQNAALLYEKAFARLDADKATKGPGSLFNFDITDPNDPAIVAFLDRHERTIALLRAGAALPDCRFDHDYARPSISLLLPELSRLRSAANFMRLHAWSELSHGRVESALADASIAFRLSRDVGREPIVLINALVAIGMDELAVRMLQESLPAVTRKDQLAGLDIGDPESMRRMLSRCLDGEEGFGLSIFSDIVSGQMSIGQLWTPGPGGIPEHASAPIPIGTLFRVFVLSDDLDAYLRVMDRFRSAAALPYSEGQAIAAEAQESVGIPASDWRADPRPKSTPAQAAGAPNRMPLTSLIAPAIYRAMRQTARAQARHASALVAIAMTRFRLDHGAFPAKLDELVPAYLEEIPADPFDGKPLRFVMKGEDAVIYSIGPDLKDDGGATYDSKTETGDFAFTLRRSTATTQPASQALLNHE